MMPTPGLLSHFVRIFCMCVGRSLDLFIKSVVETLRVGMGALD
jgi:hypothetical protein